MHEASLTYFKHQHIHLSTVAGLYRDTISINLNTKKQDVLASIKRFSIQLGLWAHLECFTRQANVFPNVIYEPG